MVSSLEDINNNQLRPNIYCIHLLNLHSNQCNIFKQLLDLLYAGVIKHCSNIGGFMYD